VANKTAKIYERVQVHGKWTDLAVSIPRLRADGTLYLKDDREGKFRISWYEGKRKQWHLTICFSLSEALVKRQIRVTSKPRLGFMTKNGRTRFVPIDRDLMNKLLALKATNRPSRLLFGTRTGLPDYHMLDTLRSVSGRAGIEPSHCWLHKFRSTCATNWLRSKRLGGKGYDIGVVRDWLGHDECKSIESYIGIVREEELIEVNEPVKVPENPTAELGIVHTPYVSDATLTRLRYAQGLLMVHVPNTLPERHCRHASLMTQKDSNSGSKT